MKVAIPFRTASFATVASIAYGSPALDPSGIDRSVSPTQDFYQFANGAWLNEAKIPGDQSSVGTFVLLQERNQDISHELAEDAAKTAPAHPKSPKDKVGLFYKVGMDEARADRLGIDPIKPELQRIDAVADRDGLVDEIAHLHSIGVRVAFGAGVGQDEENSSMEIFSLRQGGLGLRGVQTYLRDDARSVALRSKYEQTIARLLALSGESDAVAGSDAAAILAFETDLAKASSLPADMRDPHANYHKVDLQAIATANPDIEWPRFFKDLGQENPGPIDVGQPKFFAELDREMKSADLGVWKAYLRFHLIQSASPYLSKPFVDAGFALEAGMRGVTDQAPRWKRVLGATNGALGMALGQLWVERAFSPEAKDRAFKLVENLKSVLHDRIEQLDWMGPATKKQAIAKLDAIRIKVGYPAKWRDYSKLKVEDDSYVQNVLRSNEFEYRRSLARLNHPVDRSEFGMTPPTVNAYYSSSMNEIVFPAGILQPPFFDPKAPDAQNYGGIGAVIGHEMTHGFDDEGRQYDAKGNLRDWWTAEDAKRFKEKTDAIAKQYDNYMVDDDLNVNGRLTLGENIADLGGVRIAYLAYKKATAGIPQPTVDGFTPDQQFFLSYGQIWRQKVRPEAMRSQVMTDPHSPGRFRVLGVIANTPEFWSAWGATPPATPITIW